MPRTAAVGSLEAGLRHGTLTLVGDRLEVRNGAAARGFEVQAMRAVRLEQRPLYEALVVGAIAAIALAACPWIWARLVLLPVVVVSAALCFAERKLRIALELEGGRHEGIPLGTAPKDRAEGVLRRFLPLAEALSRRGVRVAS